MNPKHIIFFILVLLFYSCEGVKYSASTLVDAKTQKPVSGATVYYLDRNSKVNRSTVTDSTGKIIFNSGFTGMNFGGPKFRYRISKTGYKDITGNEKFPPATLIFEPIQQQDLSPFMRTWYINGDTCIFPEQAKTVIFSATGSGNEFCSWTFKSDLLLNIACIGKFDGLYARGGKWKVINKELQIDTLKFNIIKLSENELILEKFK